MRKKIPLLRLPYSKNERSYISKGLQEILNSGFLTMSKKVTHFEELFAKFIGTKFAVAVNSGTSALEIPLRALGVNGKTIIVPTNTFMATPLAVFHAGAKVVFADISSKTLSIDPKEIEKRITNNTVGVIPVHIGGIISSQWKEIEKICKSNNLFILEDAAHAHGSEINNKKAGTLGVAAAFSFYPTKILNTGEGGMITTNDKSLYKKFITLRDHGKENPKKNIHTDLGYNWRMAEITALLGIQQVKKVNKILYERKKQADLYNKILINTPNLKLQEIPKHLKSSYYKYIVFVNKSIRDKIKTKMQKNFGITLPGEVYNTLCHSQPVLKKDKNLLVKKGDQSFKIAKRISSEQLCLPLYPGLKDTEIKYVAYNLKKLLNDFV
tara:strand:+ start:276 stop:1421 length:1146 start_codon:yes stop_codon:yes gene_type:complete